MRAPKALYRTNNLNEYHLGQDKVKESKCSNVGTPFGRNFLNYFGIVG